MLDPEIVLLRVAISECRWVDPKDVWKRTQEGKESPPTKVHANRTHETCIRQPCHSCRQFASRPRLSDVIEWYAVRSHPCPGSFSPRSTGEHSRDRYQPS